MARKGKTLTSISSFEKTQEENEHNSKTEQTNVTDKLNNETEQLSIYDNTEQEKDSGFLKRFQEKKKPTVEETHTRQTYLINNDLLNRLNKMAKGKGKGFKTELVNYALEKALSELEEN